jgi:membrane protein
MEASEEIPAPERRADYAPKGTSTGTGLMATLKRTLTEFSEDNMTDWAAALTYYGLLAMFPALIALVSILGIFGDPATTTKAITDIVTKLGPGSAAQTFAGPIKQITESKSAAGILFFVGLGTALWSASGYVGAFMRAANIIYETPEGRPFWKLRPQQMAIAFVMVVLLAVSALAVVVTGGLARQVGNVIGLGDTAVMVWDIAKWPVLLLVVSFMFAVLYWAAPNVRQPRFRWLSPGGIAAVLIWVAASAAFAFYVANFASYNKTYGALGGVIVFLVWLWISNLAVLIGATLNAELARGKELAEGRRDAADADGPILPLRDAPKP